MKNKETLDHALKLVARHNGITVTTIFSLSRKRHIAYSRHLFRWLAYRTDLFTMDQIAQYENFYHIKINHSTVINSIKRINETHDLSKETKIQHNVLLKELKSLSKITTPASIQSMHQLHCYAATKSLKL